MSPRRSVALAFAAAAVVVLLARTVIASFLRSLLYPAPAVSVPSPPPAPLEEADLGAAPRLSVWRQPAREPGAPIVLLLHGNGENLETLRWSGLFERFVALGAEVVALDFPGYGRSAGEPSEAALATAAARAWRAHVAPAAAPRPRVVFGWSLGAAVAAQLAATEAATLDALVLASPWTRLGEVAALHFPAWLSTPLLADRYDTLGVAGDIACPTLVVHGAEDELIPAAQGRRVFAALGGAKRWLEVPGAGHNDLLGRDETWRAIGEALADARRR